MLRKMYGLIKSKIKYINFVNVNLLVYALAFLKGIISRRFVQPEEYGIYANTQLLISYGLYFQLGVLNSLNFEIPGILARNEKEKLKSVIGSAKGYISVLSIISIAIIPMFLFLDISKNLKYGYILTSILLSLNLYVTMGENVLRGYQDFGKLSRIILIKTVVMVISAGFFIYKIGFYGLYICMILGEGTAFLMFSRDLSRFRTKVNFKLVFERIKKGFPIFLNGMLWSLLITASQTLGFFKLTKAEMGEFSIAIMIYGAIVFVPSVISQIVYPKILVMISKENSRRMVNEYYNEFMGYYGYAISAATISLMMVVPYLVKFLLPEYTNGINSALVLILSLFFLSINSIIGSIITGYGKAKQQTIHIFIALMTLIIVEFVLLDKMKINGIAVALTIAYVTISIMNSVYIIKRLKLEITPILLKFLLYFMIMILPVFISIYFNQYFIGIIYGLVCILIIFYILIMKVRRKLSEI